MLNLVDIDDIEVQLSVTDNPDLTEELYRFGQIMVGDVQTVAGQLDSKLTNALGCSAATLAFVALNVNLHATTPVRFLAITATLALLCAVGLASWGLKATRVATPSQQDWFCDSLLREPDRLRNFHIVSLLTFHRSLIVRNGQKIQWLLRAEVALGIGAVAVACQILVKLF